MHCFIIVSDLIDTIIGKGTLVSCRIHNIQTIKTNQDQAGVTTGSSYEGHGSRKMKSFTASL